MLPTATCTLALSSLCALSFASACDCVGSRGAAFAAALSTVSGVSHVTGASKRYPVFAMVSICAERSLPSLASALRTWVMACVTTSLVGSVSGQTSASSCSRVTTCPGCRASASNTANALGASRGVRFAPGTCTSREATSTVQTPTRSRPMDDEGMEEELMGNKDTHAGKDNKTNHAHCARRQIQQSTTTNCVMHLIGANFTLCTVASYDRRRRQALSRRRIQTITTYPSRLWRDFFICNSARRAEFAWNCCLDAKIFQTALAMQAPICTIQN